MNFFNIFKKKCDIALITTNYSNTIRKSDALVLSPEFYWVKKVRLNVRFAFEVKKMAESIFADSLPDGSYSYIVLKSAPKEFIVIAYDLDYIIKKLKNLGIDISKVKKIYTIQSEIKESKFYIESDKESGLAIVDKIVTPVPLRYLDASVAKKVTIKEFLSNKLSKNYIYPSKKGTEIFEKKDMIRFSLLPIFVLLFLSVNFFTYKKEIKYLEKLKESYIKTYTLPSTTFEIKSMLEEAEKLDKKQRSIREVFEYLQDFKLYKNENFYQMLYDKNRVKITIKLKDKKRYDEFDHFIAGRYKIISRKKIDNGYVLEIIL